MTPQDLVIYLLLALVVALLWYICKQEYGKSSCSLRRLTCLYNQADSVSDNQNTEGDTETVSETPKKIIDPEKDVTAEQFLGDNLERVTMNDPLTMDPFADLKSGETSDQMLQRNLLTANSDGPQIEGMEAPISSFENNALSRQLVKSQEIYGDQQYSSMDADFLSSMNI